MKMKVATPQLDIAAMSRPAREAVALALKAGAGKVLNSAKKRIARGQKSGRVYSRRGTKHQASAPGEPPATDTGRLVSSGTSDGDEKGAFVRFDALYAVPLEFGTSRMAARPFLVPSVEENLRGMQDDVSKAARTAVSPYVKKGARPR